MALLTAPCDSTCCLMLLTVPKHVHCFVSTTPACDSPHQFPVHRTGQSASSSWNSCVARKTGTADLTAAPVLCCRLAQATYRTPSTAATGQGEQSSPSAASFQFACSPVRDNTSPLATFFHNLSHATYEASPSASSAEVTDEASTASLRAQCC